MTPSNPSFDGDRFEAVLFDLDGVLTDTASLHAAAWKRTFDEYLQGRADRLGEPFVPFEIATDYRRYVDGKPRFDGVRDFLASRGIELPEGTPSSPPDEESVCGVGNRKNELINTTIVEQGVDAYPGSVEWIRQLREQGTRTAVVTSSSNCSTVLKAAGIADLFETQVDGQVARELGLKGKPSPDPFLEAARRLDLPPERCVVVEDAISGVEAGRAGKFGLVLGVARKGDAEDLAAHGADRVVLDLSEMLSSDGDQG